MPWCTYARGRGGARYLDIALFILCLESLRLTPRLAGRLGGVLPLLALILGCATVVLGYQTMQLQNMIYNYPPRIFAYPKDELLCDLNQPGANGMMHLFVVIVTPHNGYAVVNQTFFQLSYGFYSKDVLDPNLLRYNNASMYREAVFAVPAGSFQTTLEIAFLCEVRLGFKWLQPGHAVEFPMGTVGVRVTFYDVQADRTYATDTTTTVWVTYSTITLPSGSSLMTQNASFRLGLSLQSAPLMIYVWSVMCSTPHGCEDRAWWPR